MLRYSHTEWFGLAVWESVGALGTWSNAASLVYVLL